MGSNDRVGSNDDDGRLDPTAAADLYGRCADELRAYLTGLLRDRDLAAETLQAAFAKAVEKAGGVEPDGRKAWLFRVAHNEAMDRRRRQAAEGRAVRKAAWWRPATAEPADASARRAETIEQVRRAVDALPAEQREVVRLRLHEDKTFAEIAAATGSPLGTVLTRMRLATKRLATLLRDETTR